MLCVNHHFEKLLYMYVANDKTTSISVSIYFLIISRREDKQYFLLYSGNIIYIGHKPSDVCPFVIV